jgi:hypothetical protein
MVAEREQQPAIEWSGYKTATFVVSIVSVVIIVGQAILGHYYTERWKQVDYLTGELNRKREELARQESAPRLEVGINTLKRAGVSSEMLSAMKAFPSTVEVRNDSGGTAKGLVLELASSEPITQFQKWPTLDPFSVTRIDGRTLRIEASEVRKGSSVGVTFLTPKPPTVESHGTVDVGDIVRPDTASTPVQYRNEAQWLTLLQSEQVLKETQDEPARLRPLKMDVKVLENQIGNLRSQSLWDFVSADVSSRKFC